MRDGLRRMARAIKRQAQPGVGFRVIGFELDGLLLLENCLVNLKTTYVLFFTESFPITSNSFEVRDFGLYTVYTPK